MEPNPDKHFIFDTFSEALEAWMLLSPEQQEVIASPRQAIPDVWIFDKPNEEE